MIQKGITEPVKKFVIYYAWALVVAVTGAMIFRLLTGDHPECNINPDVGPCGFWSFVLWPGAAYFLIALPVWPVGLVIWAIVFAGDLTRKALTRKLAS